MARLRVTAVCLLALSALAARSAAADDLQVTVNGIGTPAPSLKLNGNQTTQGTIQLFYTVADYAFPVGPFAQFSIDMTDLHLTGASGAYPAALTLKQNGSQSLVLTPDQTNFNITGLGWTASSVVQITIPAGASNEDGTDPSAISTWRCPGRTTSAPQRRFRCTSGSCTRPPVSRCTTSSPMPTSPRSWRRRPST